MSAIGRIASVAAIAATLAVAQPIVARAADSKGSAQLLRAGWALSAPSARKVGAAAWTKAVRVRFDYDLHSQRDVSADATSVYLLEDAKYLYVGFLARQRVADPLDAVTLHLWSSRAAYTFRADESGAKLAKCSIDPHFSPAWRAVETPTDGGYSIAMRVPRAVLSGDGQSRLLVRFGRTVPSTGATFAWPVSAKASAPGAVADALRRYVAASVSSRGGSGSVARHRVNFMLPVTKRTEVFGLVHSREVHRNGAASGGTGFSERYQELWPAAVASDTAALTPPSIPNPVNGIGVARTQNHVRFVGVDASGAGGRNDSAQSVGYTTDGDRIFAGLQRIETTQGRLLDISQGLTFMYDNKSNFRVAGGIASDRGTNVTDASRANFDFYDFRLYGKKSRLDMRWSSAGSQYNPLDEYATSPGTSGYTVRAQRALGNVRLSGTVNRYQDDLGELRQADQQAKLSVDLTKALSLAVTDGSTLAEPYQSNASPYSRSGVRLILAGSRGHRLNVSFHADRLQGGFAQESAFSGAFDVPILGSVTLEHRQTNFWSRRFGRSRQVTSGAGLTHKLSGDGTLSIAYDYTSGARPLFAPLAGSPVSSLSFGWDQRLAFGSLQVQFSDPNTLFPAPGFTLNIVPNLKRHNG